MGASLGRCLPVGGFGELYGARMDALEDWPAAEEAAAGGRRESVSSAPSADAAPATSSSSTAPSSSFSTTAGGSAFLSGEQMRQCTYFQEASVARMQAAVLGLLESAEPLAAQQPAAAYREAAVQRARALLGAVAPHEGGALSELDAAVERQAHRTLLAEVLRAALARCRGLAEHGPRLAGRATAAREVPLFVAALLAGEPAATRADLGHALCDLPESALGLGRAQEETRVFVDLVADAAAVVFTARAAGVSALLSAALFDAVAGASGGLLGQMRVLQDLLARALDVDPAARSRAVLRELLSTLPLWLPLERSYREPIVRAVLDWDSFSASCS